MDVWCQLLTLLDFRYASHKVIETLRLGLSSEDGECQVMVLEVETNTRKVDDWLDADFLELLWVT